MLFNKNKEKIDKVVYVLGGFSQSKLRYFNQRNDKNVRAILMEMGRGQSPNNAINIDWLCKKRILENNPYAKVLLNNEEQFNYINSKKKLINWFKKNINQFIVTKFTFDDTDITDNPSLIADKLYVNEFLSRKENFLNGKSVVSHTKVMTGSEYNKLKESKKKNVVVKSVYGSGNTGALLSPSKVDHKGKYIIEKVIKSTDTTKFYVCTTVVTPNEKTGKDVSLLITSEDHSEFVDTGYPHTRADFSQYTKLKEFMTYITNVLGVTSGLFETEVVYDEKNDIFYLIDLNPRWSTDHDCVKEKFGEIVGKKFDMMDFVYEGKPFYKKVEKFLKRHKNYIGPMKYYSSVFVNMNTEFIDLTK